MKNLQVVLRGGYAIDVGSKGWQDHLFNAILGTNLHVAARGRNRGKDMTFDVRDQCLLEIHYVAGQLVQMRSSITLRSLLVAFAEYSDRVARTLERNKVGR